MQGQGELKKIISYFDNFKKPLRVKVENEKTKFIVMNRSGPKLYGMGVDSIGDSLFENS